MTAEQQQRLEDLIRGQGGAVKVYECRPQPITMTPGLVRQRFAGGGEIEMIPDGGMAVTQPDGSLLCLCAP